MLTLKHVTKVYVNKKSKAKDLTALEDINITFPRQGFVSILGPSGCGKTTLLNILGGLDTDYSGEFIVNNINTKNFKKSDWDAYRNNHVGFVFQEYNLIPHETVSKNVELVLTIAGAPKIQTKDDSKKVLETVGLKEKINENPNNLSGGQKQRVAIARALVNNPELILADEPTSALDTETSKQVMDILKKISQKKLVIMVTHNIELAKKYSSRIINLLDGKVTLDEKLESTEEKDEFLEKLPQTYKYGKSKMKFITAAGLSLKSLMSKKRRTFLTTLVGSIGIVSLAVILGISNGATKYVTETNKATQDKRPITIENYIPVQQYNEFEQESETETTSKSSNSQSSTKESNDQSNEIKNPSFENQKEEKKPIKTTEKPDPKKDKYYNLTPDLVNYIKASMDKMPDVIKAIDVKESNIPNIILSDGNKFSLEKNYADFGFSQIPESKSLDSSFSLVGKNSRWPTKKEEVVIVLGENNEWSYNWINSLGLKNKKSFSPDNFIGKEIATIPMHNDYYKLTPEGLYRPSNEKELQEIASSPNSIHLTCVGVIKPIKNSYETQKTIEQTTRKLDKYYPYIYPISAGVAYTKELGNFVKQNIENSDIVKEQKLRDYNVINYVIGPAKKRKISNLTKQNILNYELGVYEQPQKVRIFIKDPDKNRKNLIDYLQNYSDGKDVKKELYIPAEGFIQTQIKIINNICLFLGLTIGAAALLSSLIMVALLTFISVLERTKEIGVLRSIGARKKDISRLFRSEALITGFFTGFVGLTLGLIAQFVLNKMVSAKAHMNSLRLVDISPTIAIMLMGSSLIVTLLAALIPAKIASRKDPVKILTGK